MVDQRLAAINADDLHIRVLKGHVLHPVARATGQVEHVMDVCDVQTLGEKTTHVLGSHLMQVGEPHHFCAALRVN